MDFREPWTSSSLGQISWPSCSTPTTARNLMPSLPLSVQVVVCRTTSALFPFRNQAPQSSHWGENCGGQCSRIGCNRWRCRRGFHQVGRWGWTLVFLSFHHSICFMIWFTGHSLRATRNSGLLTWTSLPKPWNIWRRFLSSLSQCVNNTFPSRRLTARRQDLARSKSL